MRGTVRSQKVWSSSIPQPLDSFSVCISRFLAYNVKIVENKIQIYIISTLKRRSINLSNVSEYNLLLRIAAVHLQNNKEFAHFRYCSSKMMSRFLRLRMMVPVSLLKIYYAHFSIRENISRLSVYNL